MTIYVVKTFNPKLQTVKCRMFYQLFDAKNYAVSQAAEFDLFESCDDVDNWKCFFHREKNGIFVRVDSEEMSD